MPEHGLRDGDGGMVILKLNRKSVGEVAVGVIRGAEVLTHVYFEDEESLVVMKELLAASLAAVNFFIEKKRLQWMIQERIKELQDYDEEAGEDYPPAPSISDIPF